VRGCLKKKKITNSLLVRNDDGSSSDPPELSDDSSSTATDASQMQRELATVTNRQPKTDATKVLSSKTSVTHEGLSEDDSLSSALIRKIYTTFTKRENGGQTTDVHHKIETSFKRKLKPAEWVLVQNKIDELLDNAESCKDEGTGTMLFWPIRCIVTKMSVTRALLPNWNRNCLAHLIWHIVAVTVLVIRRICLQGSPILAKKPHEHCKKLSSINSTTRTRRN